MTDRMIIVDDALRAYIDPLTPDEHAALERSLLEEGCRDALVLWGDLLVDGHNRYGICQKHGLEFNTIQNTRFKTIEDVHLWMIDNHLGRRSVSDFQRGILALRKKDILLARRQDVADEPAESESVPVPAPPVVTRQTLAKAARLSSSTLGQIEKIQKTAAPELVDAIKTGAISINAAAAVASLPQAEQSAAVAGGRKELQQAARQVRQARQVLKAPAEAAPADDDLSGISDFPAEVLRLRRLLLELGDERDALKKKVMHLTVALAEARRADAD